MTTANIILVIIIAYCLLSLLSMNLLLSNKRIRRRNKEVKVPKIIDKQFHAELQEFLDEHEKSISN